MNWGPLDYRVDKNWVLWTAEYWQSRTGYPWWVQIREWWIRLATQGGQQSTTIVNWPKWVQPWHDKLFVFQVSPLFNGAELAARKMFLGRRNVKSDWSRPHPRVWPDAGLLQLPPKQSGIQKWDIWAKHGYGKRDAWTHILLASSPSLLLHPLWRAGTLTSSPTPTCLQEKGHTD